MNIKYVLLFCFLLSDSFLYWENLSKKDQDSFILNIVESKDLSNFLEGKFKLFDNKRTRLLLDMLSDLPTDKKTKALYFNVFNQICQKADGEFGEILGSYCQKILLSDVEYVVYYLRAHPELRSKYAIFLGMEFYFKDEGVSDMKYDFKDFKKRINEKLRNTQKYQDFLFSFYNEIAVDMKNME